VQHCSHVIASTFGEIIKWKAAYASMVEKLLYNKPHRTKAMQYGNDNEPKAQDLYCEYLHKFHYQQASVKRTGFQIDYKV